MIKTNAIRVLEKKEIKHNILPYDIEDNLIDGISVANKIGKNVEEVYKTLVGQGKEQIYVFLIPVSRELDYKKAAIATNEKKIELIHVKDITKITGYIRGGCSPIGMKKLYPTFIDENCLDLDVMVVSGGKIGIQIELNPRYLGDIVKAMYCDLIR